MPRLDKKDPVLKAINANDMGKVQKAINSKKFVPFDLAHDQMGWNAMTLAALKGNTEALDLLIKAGVIVDCVDGMGRTVLYIASQTNNVKVAKWAIENKCNIDFVCTISQQTVLSPKKASKKKSTDVVAEAKQGQKVTAVDVCHEQASHDVLQLLGNEVGKWLIEAVKIKQNSEVQKVERLLQRPGININKADFTGWTPLHVAMKAGSEKLVTLLAVNGADHTLRNALGKTPMDVAKEQGNEAICRTFFEAKSENLSSSLSSPALAGAPPMRRTGSTASDMRHRVQTQPINRGAEDIAAEPLSAPSAFRGAARGRAAARRGGHTRGVSVGAVGVMGVEGGKRDDADDRPPSSTPGSAATDQHKQNRAQFRRSVGVMQGKRIGQGLRAMQTPAPQPPPARRTGVAHPVAEAPQPQDTPPRSPTGAPAKPAPMPPMRRTKSVGTSVPARLSPSAAASGASPSPPPPRRTGPLPPPRRTIGSPRFEDDDIGDGEAAAQRPPLRARSATTTATPLSPGGRRRAPTRT